MKYNALFKRQLSIIQKLESGIIKIILTVMVETFLRSSHLSSQNTSITLANMALIMMVRMIYFVQL